MSAKYSSNNRYQLLRMASGSTNYVYLPISQTPTNSVQVYAVTALTGTYALQYSNLTAGDVGDPGSPKGSEAAPTGSDGYWKTDTGLTGSLNCAAGTTSVLLQFGNIGSRWARLQLVNQMAGTPFVATASIAACGKE